MKNFYFCFLPLLKLILGCGIAIFLFACGQQGIEHTVTTKQTSSDTSTGNSNPVTHSQSQIPGQISLPTRPTATISKKSSSSTKVISGVDELTTKYYEWEKNIYKFRNEYSNRCVFPSQPYHKKGTLKDELFAWRDLINQNYLFNDEIEDTNPNNFSIPITNFESHYRLMTAKNSYIQSLRSFKKNEEGELVHGLLKTETTEYLDSLQPIFWRRDNQPPRLGIDWEVVSNQVQREYIVRFIFPDTPASKFTGQSMIKRGDKLLSIDGIDFVNVKDHDKLLKLKKLLRSTTFVGNTKIVLKDRDTKLEKTYYFQSKDTFYVYTPLRTVIDTPTGKVGYLHIGRFGVNTREYHRVVDFWKNNNVTDVILDFRYFDQLENVWSHSRPESSFSYMLFGKEIPSDSSYRVAGVIPERQFDSSNPNLFFNHVAFNHRCPVFYDKVSKDWGCVSSELKRWKDGMFSNNHNATRFKTFNTLNLKRIIILVSEHSCHKAELFINALRGINLDISLIGERTCGYPFKENYINNCGISVKVITKRYVNYKRFGYYEEGFKPSNSQEKYGVIVPGCYVNDDFTRELGDVKEGMLSAALQYRKNKTCPSIE